MYWYLEIRIIGLQLGRHHFLLPLPLLGLHPPLLPVWRPRQPLQLLLQAEDRALERRIRLPAPHLLYRHADFCRPVAGFVRQFCPLGRCCRARGSFTTCNLQRRALIGRGAPSCRHVAGCRLRRPTAGGLKKKGRLVFVFFLTLRRLSLPSSESKLVLFVILIILVAVLLPALSSFYCRCLVVLCRTRFEKLLGSIVRWWRGFPLVLFDKPNKK